MSNQEEAQPAQKVQLDSSPRAGEALLNVYFVFMHANINHSCGESGTMDTPHLFFLLSFQKKT